MSLTAWLRLVFVLAVFCVSPTIYAYDNVIDNNGAPTGATNTNVSQAGDASNQKQTVASDPFGSALERGKAAIGKLGTTLGSMFANFSQYYGSIARLLNDVALLLAIVFGISALIKLKNFVQDPQQNPMSHTLALFVVAGALANIGLMATIGGNSIYGDGYSFIAYNQTAQTGSELSSEGLAILRGVIGFIQLMGFIAFFKGWLMLRNTGKPGGGGQDVSFSRGLVFIIGGILSINIVSTVTLMAVSVGSGDTVTKILGTG